MRGEEKVKGQWGGKTVSAPPFPPLHLSFSPHCGYGVEGKSGGRRDKGDGRWLRWRRGWEERRRAG